MMVDKKTLQDIKNLHFQLLNILVSFIEVYSGDDKYCSRFFTGIECPYLDENSESCNLTEEPEVLDSEWCEIEEHFMFLRSKVCRFKR
jgi:hypothetical protein